jgi:hypothetical protein
MASFTFNNKTYKIPGAYSRVQVINEVGAPLPEFNIALIIAKQLKGVPYDVSGEDPVRLYSKQNEVREYFGTDSDIDIAFQYFKKHGGNAAYCLGASDATQSTAKLQDAVPADVIALTSRDYGSYTKDINIKVETSGSDRIITITNPEDSSDKEISGALSTLDACVAFLNTSNWVTAVKEDGASTLPDDVDDTLENLPSGTAGTSPDPDGDDYDNIIALLPSHIQEKDIRLICPVAYETLANQQAILVAFRDFAISQRDTEERPIQIVCGGLLGDIDLTKTGATDYDNPVKRTAALNNQDVILAVGGIDGKAPYISSAPGVLGMLAANAIAHNLTRDVVVASTLEKKWTTTQLEMLLDAGCIPIGFRNTSYFIVKGVNSLQANTQSWNESNQTTYLPMQRAIVDYIQKTLVDGIDANFIGTDGVTEEKIRVYCFNTFETLADIEPELFSEYKIESIERSGTEGWEVKWAIIPAMETNYIGCTTQVIVSVS